MMKSFSIVLLPCLLVVFLGYATTPASAATCTFEIRVQTGSDLVSGTDSKVTLQLSGARGRKLTIRDLRSWGKMAPDHDYFERGNLDRFGGTATCFSRRGPCWMRVSIDGKGSRPGWYVSYVQVTQEGPAVTQRATHKWAVEQWLARDEPPKKLFAVRDDCPRSNNSAAAEAALPQRNHSALSI